MKKELKEVIDIFEHAMFHIYLAIVFGTIAMVKDGRTSLIITACLLNYVILMIRYKNEKKKYSNNEIRVLLVEEHSIRIKVCRNICLSFVLVAIISLLLNVYFDVKIIYTKIAVVATMIFFLVFVILKVNNAKRNQ